MKTILEKYRCDSVWHFTDRANLESIREHGLLSFAEARKRRVNISIRGGNELSQNLDSRYGLDRFVHLTFIPNHPMLYRACESGRIQNPLWIKIDSSVILSKDTQFCAGVSISNDAPILDAKQAKTAIDFEVLFANRPWENSALKPKWDEVRKSEILVPNFIPIDKILGIQNG